MATTSRARARTPGDELREQLDGLRVVDVPTLHDRRVPRSSTPLDHLLVTAAGVWVLDPQRVCGPLTFAVRGRPGLFQALLVQGKVHSVLLTRMHQRIDAVRKVLVDAGADEVPVRGAICFVKVRPTPGLTPLEARGVLVTWSDELGPLVLESGPFDPEDRAAIHRVLDRGLPSAR